MPKSIPNEKCETVGSGNVGVYKLKCLIVALYFLYYTTIRSSMPGCLKSRSTMHLCFELNMRCQLENLEKIKVGEGYKV